ncbi:hypothetical protein T459_26213 [Capsicum annuum]|uniref:AN1-type domain-containing protein n=1 Tax=Capsicum annuum TaxID=4072 RepID=A0A2G2YMW7_CAPAN|nr:hypothetical protein T459_26213 [Capsicum annuum]
MFHAKKAFLFRRLQQVLTLRYLDVLTTQAENSHDLGKRLRSTNTGDGNRVMDYFAWFGCIELWKVNMISNPKRREVHLGLVLKVDSQDLRRDTCGVDFDLLTVEMESSKETATSGKDVVRRSSSSDESELALAGAAVASADLASQISQVKSKEGLKKCTACRKRVGLTGFSCKYGDLFCAVHHYSDKHNCPFDYRNAGKNAIAKATPIILEEKLNKI